MMLPWSLSRFRKPLSLSRQPRGPGVRQPVPLRLEALEERLTLSTLLVTSTADDGPGSLRQAILDANATPGANTIAFDIGGGGAQTITPLTPLPAITNPVVLDGTTQPGYHGNPLIELNGSELSRIGAGRPEGTIGLLITAGNSTVAGLAINRFQDTDPHDRGMSGAIDLENNGGNVIKGCYLGTDITGTVALGNDVGVWIGDSSGNVIGGTAPGDANLISANRSAGVLDGGTNNLVEGNLIGTNAAGTARLGDQEFGVELGPNSTLGGTGPGARNVISGNGIGVALTSNDLVEGNYIGTDVTGTVAVGNDEGVRLTSASFNTLGGTAAGAGNLISGNRMGVLLYNSATWDNVVQGNYIGTDASGTRALGNQYGVYVEAGANGNLIGGMEAGAGNLISGNVQGLVITGSGTTANVVQGNRIGTDASGTAALGNTGNGIQILGTVHNLIGGTAAGAGNLISGNALDGLFIAHTDPSYTVLGNLVQGNRIGTDASGTAALGNGNDGVEIAGTASQNVIGGAAAGAGNLISGNAHYGVAVTGLTSLSNQILGNRIGTGVSGTAALGNGGGVLLAGGAYTSVGGAAAGAGNLISGNTGAGVLISAGGINYVQVNRIQGNRIGTDVSGTAALGNGTGVEVSGTSAYNLIGGVAAGDGNLISGNRMYGVSLTGNGITYILVQGNRIGTDASGTVALSNSTGVFIAASNNIIGGTDPGARNVISGNASAGVFVSAGSGNRVQGNYVGTDATGTAALANGVGVSVAGSNNLVGGTAPGAGNLISGNGNEGIFISGNSNLVQGNYIGTDVSGTAPLGNAGNGLIVGGDYNTIGGTTPGAGNLISGNADNGVYLSAPNNTVQGNYIGTDATGTRALGNQMTGVYVIASSASNELIGGAADGAGNVISGNGRNGIQIDTPNNTVQGNRIGTDATGTVPLGNRFGGVFIEHASNNLIGGAGAGNVISGNPMVGVYIIGTNSTATGNLVQGNYIGTDISGTRALGNGIGVTLDSAPDNTIGGTAAGAGNLISGNTGDGIYLFGTSNQNVVQGNRIGTDVSGTWALGNQGDGVAIILRASNNQIGGTAAGAGNLISGNGKAGVFISDLLTEGNVVQGNYIGTDATGTRALGNPTGVLIQQAARNSLIGGTAAGAGNVISGNQGDGIRIVSNFQETTGNVVQGNYIGTDATGTQPLGNQVGVTITGFDANNNTVGGTAAGAGNLISGNHGAGVFIGSLARRTLVQGNRIGTDITGTRALGNQTGVLINSFGNTVGGTTAAAANVIAANGGAGVLISGADAMFNLIQGNFIGTDPSATLNLGNAADGVTIQGASYNTIGGTAAGAGNTIAFNGHDGVLVDTGTRNAILSDLIFANGHLGIELRNGGNKNRAAPRLTSANQDGPNTVIQGVLRGTPNTTFTLQLFADPAADPSGSAQGQQLLGTFTVTTDAYGFAAFTVTVTGSVPAGQVITATVTDAGNDTSAFSTPVTVSGA